MSLLLLKELIIKFLFVVTAAGVVPCGIPKKRPRTSSIVQFIFYFWSFEISRNILRNQKTLSVYMCHRLNCDVYLGDVLGSVLMCIFNVD